MRNWLLPFFLFGALSVSSQDPIVIANSTGADEWQTEQIQDIFIGERSFWDNDKPVTVVLPFNKTESFEKTANWALDSDGFDYQKHWLSLVFQGRANAPVFVANEIEIIRYVTSHEGAVGILHFTEGPEEFRMQIQ